MSPPPTPCFEIISHGDGERGTDGDGMEMDTDVDMTMDSDAQIEKVWVGGLGWVRHD